MATETLEAPSTDQAQSTGQESTNTSSAGNDSAPKSDSSKESTWLKSDGTFDHQYLPEKWKDEYSTISRYKNVDNVVKALVEGRKRFGDPDKLLEVPIPPGEDASKEDVAKYEKAHARWRKAIGAPESADGYKITPEPEDIPEGMEWNDGIEKSFREVAHKLDLSQTQAKELMKFHVELQKMGFAQNQEAIEHQINANQAELQKEWGGLYRENIKFAERGAKILGVKSFNPQFSIPEYTRAFAEAGRLFAEDKHRDGGSVPHVYGRSWAMAVIEGTDSGLKREHEAYINGIGDMRKRVQDALRLSTGE